MSRLAQVFTMACLGPLLSACVVAETPEEFQEIQVELECEYHQSCQPDYFDRWEDIDACIEDGYLRYGAPEWFGSICPDYDPEEGARCLRYLRRVRDQCVEIEDDEWEAECGHICGTYGLED